MARPRKPERRHRNLLRMFDKVNAAYFSGTACGGICWSNMRIGVDQVTFASCQLEERIIRINTLLDDSRVPYWYVEFVVFHEMLHLHLGHNHYNDDRKEEDHTPRFVSLEKRHPHYKKACEYEEKKLKYITSCWRKWKTYNRNTEG